MSKLGNCLIRATATRYLLHAFYSYFMILNGKKTSWWIICLPITHCNVSVSASPRGFFVVQYKSKTDNLQNRSAHLIPYIFQIITSHKTAPLFETVHLGGKKHFVYNHNLAVHGSEFDVSEISINRLQSRKQYCWFNSTEIELKSNLVCWLINTIHMQMVLHCTQINWNRQIRKTF